MLMAGVQNFPLSEPGFADFMTMKMIGITQTIPWPGKLSGRVSIADEELAGARAAVIGAQRSVARQVRTLYYDLAFTTRALDVVTRTQGVVAAMIPVTETRYASGSGSQSEILRMRVETARLANEAAMLVEERRATLTELNALLERPADAPVGDAAVPIAIARAAIADSASAITFESASLGARVKGSPIPTVDSLLALAVRNSAALKEHEAMMRAQRARVALARRERLPDVDVSLQYGQRNGFADMVTAVVSVPIPLQKHRKQDAEVSAADADLRALEAEHMVALNELRARLARLDGALERDRTQLALYVRSILPQARASLASANAGYQAGRVEFATLIDAQALLFNYETDYSRTLTDFAKTLAELEEQTGMELIQ
jgi:outer membrane protein TolC